MNRTQFKNFVSVILSTITHSKRVIRATVALFREISTPQEPAQLSDEYLREIIKPLLTSRRGLLIESTYILWRL
ncbi:hypothetical protein LH53_01435 [Mesotoga sp. TolDC]|nr:hypothetical protein LH53_01435 [Mesotoga sp. TolDC]